MRTSLLAFGVLALASAAVPVAATATTTAPTALTCATTLVSAWTPSAQAHEVVTVSLSASQAGVLPALRSAASRGFGGVLLFGSTAPVGLVATLRSLPALSPAKLHLAVMGDEEGGGVIRLTNLVGTWPWAQVMGRTMTASAIQHVGYDVGQKLKAAGLTMDLAPVADVDGRDVYPGASDPDGLRSFGGSAATDGRDAAAFAQGLASAGVVATLKHFPGLGGASGNTDDGPATTLPWSQLRGDVVSFRTGINNGVGAVMLSNAVVPGLSTLPASLSPQVVAVLRGWLGFHGLIVTDSLGAGAISALGLGQVAAAPRAIEAGADEVLAGQSTTPAQGLLVGQQMVSAILAADRSGALNSETLALAAAHVVAALNPLVCRA